MAKHDSSQEEWKALVQRSTAFLGFLLDSLEVEAVFSYNQHNYPAQALLVQNLHLVELKVDLHSSHTFLGNTLHWQESLPMNGSSEMEYLIEGMLETQPSLDHYGLGVQTYLADT
jgi:hypothetical protein